MSKRWTFKDDGFLVVYYVEGNDQWNDYIASHDLGFKSKGAAKRRVAKLKELGIWEKFEAYNAARAELVKAHNLAFGPQWAREMVADNDESSIASTPATADMEA